MGDHTAIEWTDASWNPTRGCSRISPGCENCYAERQAIRQAGPGGGYEGLVRASKSGAPRWTGAVRLVPEQLDLPLRWRRPRRIFVDSMSDLFHESLTDEQIATVFAVMGLTVRHTFQVLTKRAERMARWFAWAAGGRHVWRAAQGIAMPRGENKPAPGWPLPNVWVGVSVEDQQRAVERIPHLLATPAAVRFVSLEPLLGGVDLWEWIGPHECCSSCGAVEKGLRRDENGVPREDCAVCGDEGTLITAWGEPQVERWRTGERYASEESLREDEGPPLDWIIVGGESGPGARPCDVSWIRSIVEQCRAANVPAFVKQLGSRPVDGAAFRMYDRKGGDPAEWPEDLRVREMPRVEVSRG